VGKWKSGAHLPNIAKWGERARVKSGKEFMTDGDFHPRRTYSGDGADLHQLGFHDSMGGVDVHVHDVARHEPVEQHGQRGQIAWAARIPPWSSLTSADKRGGMEGLNAGDLGNAVGGPLLGQSGDGVRIAACGSWSLLSCTMKTSSTRFAAFGVGVKSLT
jgi:hypothetical protein